MTGPESAPNGHNPFAPPDATTGRTFIVLPGWIVFTFGIIAASAPLSVLFDDKLLTSLTSSAFHSIERDLLIQMWVNIVLYGVPGMCAALFFGRNNLRVGKDRGLSITGIVLAVSALVIGGIASVMAAMR